MEDPIVHITSAAEWEVSSPTGTYRSSSLTTEGFIHFSFPDQLLRVANAGFRGQSDLVLLIVDPQRLQAPLRLEEPEPGAPKFPHLYGQLNTDAVIGVLPFSQGPNGFELPQDLHSLGSSKALGFRRSEVERVIHDVLMWARGRRDVLGLAKVGSWAREEAGLDSDLDLILLTRDRDAYLKGSQWTKDLGLGSIVRTEGWGPNLTERRFALPSGLEIDLGVARPPWVATEPVDEGTKKVISGGIQVLYDPEGLFERLIERSNHDSTTG